MARLRVTITGGDRIEAYLANLHARVREAARPALQAAAERVRNTAIEKINAPPKTGKLYKKSSPRRIHQASAPGEYPAADTGNLARSINTDGADDFAPEGLDIIQANVFAEAAYAAPLEYKPEDQGGRPFLRRSLAEHAPDVIELVRDAVRKAVRP